MIPILLVLAGTGFLAAASGSQRVAAVVSSAERALGRDLKLPPATEAAAARWAKARNLPLNWLRAIIFVESGGVPTRYNTNARAMSRGGAWGLGAMTLLTARDLIKQGALNGYPQIAARWNGTGRSLLDPDLNLAVVSFYIAQLAREFKRFDKVAAAYHSGPGLVRKISAAGAQLPSGLGEKGQLALQMYSNALARTVAV